MIFSRPSEVLQESLLRHNNVFGTFPINQEEQIGEEDDWLYIRKLSGV